LERTDVEIAQRKIVCQIDESWIVRSVEPATDPHGGSNHLSAQLTQRSEEFDVVHRVSPEAARTNLR
jgi:hypothetical protein